jgi:hypothetical protein
MMMMMMIIIIIIIVIIIELFECPFYKLVTNYRLITITNIANK